MKLLGDFEVVLKRKGEEVGATFLIKEIDALTSLEVAEKQRELNKGGKYQESLSLQFEVIKKNIISVKGFQKESGEDYTLEEFNNLALPFFMQTALVRGYNEAQAKLYSSGDPEKK